MADNTLRAAVRENVRVVRAAKFGKFQHTLQGPRGSLTSGQIYDGANAVENHPDFPNPEPGQGWSQSTFEFFMTITDDGGNGQLVDTDFTSILSDGSQQPAIIAVESGGGTPAGIAHWEAQSADPSGDTISIPAVPSNPATDVVEMKFTVTGTALKLTVRNLNEREYVIREPDNFNFDKIDYGIRALFFNTPAGVELSLDSVQTELSYTFPAATFPSFFSRSDKWNLVSAL